VDAIRRVPPPTEANMHFNAVLLAPGSLNHIANTVKGYALAIGVAFAIWLAWQWWRSRQADMSSERAVRARETWARHQTLMLQMPELAEPMLGSLSSPIEVARYRIFVAALLATGDQILALEPSDQWRATLGRHLAPHASYLGSNEFRAAGFTDCSPAMQQVIATVTRSQGA
jgi:hypothetical protein